MGAMNPSAWADEDGVVLTAAAPFLGTIHAVDLLSGGMVSSVFRAADIDGRAVVVKTATDPPEDLFAIEAAGLVTLRELGGLPVPHVLAVHPTYLVLEAMHPSRPDDDAYWDSAGRAIAALHQQEGDRFGGARDGWLGRLPQVNTWTSDGHEFFAEHRLLRYLAEPLVFHTVSEPTRRGIERICSRLPELVPTMPAVLTHGDLWRNNLVATASGRPTFIDPAVSWTWAEVDLSMALCADGIPERFFLSYNEIRPMYDGWRERAELLNLRELLSIVAHFGAIWDVPGKIDRVVRRFAGLSPG